MALDGARPRQVECFDDEPVALSQRSNALRLALVRSIAHNSFLIVVTSIVLLRAAAV